MKDRKLTLKDVANITTRINSEQDIHSLLTTIMDTGRSLTDSEGSSLLLYDAEKEELVFDIARGYRGEVLANKRIPAGQGIAGQCATLRKSFIVNDALNDPRILRSVDQDIGFRTRNLMASPMVARGELIGVLEVVNTIDGRDYSRHDASVLNYLAGMAALAIHNRQLFNALKNRADELDCIYEISQTIQQYDSLEDLLDAILQAIERVLDVERLSVLLRDQNDSGFRLARLRGFSVSDKDVRIDPDEGVSAYVLRTGDPLLVRDLEKDMRVVSEHAGRYRTSSFISVPVFHGERIIGLLNAADKKDGLPFDAFELKVLSTVASQLADAYQRIVSRNRDIEIQMYRKDLETAAQIQRNSLPEIPESIAGMTLATRYEACRDVGGDFYDFFYHSDDRVSLLMADVAGKGVPAALFMEYSKTLLASQIPIYMDPAGTLDVVNRELMEKSRMGLFVTTMLIQVERKEKRLRIGSAGHNHQILYRKNENRLELLSATGPPLGAFVRAHYKETTVSYEPGDLIVLYTDGITEAHNHHYEEFGEDRLFDLIRRLADEDPAYVVAGVFQAVDEFRSGRVASDDTTILVARL